MIKRRDCNSGLVNVSMASKSLAKIDENLYDVDELQRPTTASSHHSKTVIRYIGPRTLGLNHANSFQGSLRNFTLSNFNSSTTTSHGLASLISSNSFTTMSSIQSINGERAIDEYRELNKLNQTLTEAVLTCCTFDAHNRAQELQIEWLQRHADQNSSIIEKMFRTEIESAQQLIYDARRYKTDLETKLNDIHQTTLANDQQYQQLLAKRNTTNRDLFSYQRQLAQNRAEAEFLRARLQQFNEECQFYTLKNNGLHARQSKLRYELDEEIFAKQTLQMELEVLSNEKITNEDVRLSGLDEAKNAIDLRQVATVQPSNSYREQLNHELRRIRSEYEKKIETYREELHRRFELEIHRYQMYKARPTPSVNQEHEQKLTQYRREKKETDQQISLVRTRITDLQLEIKSIEKRIDDEKSNGQSFGSSRRNLTTLEQIIREREQQLKEAIQTRTALKQQIERYRENIERYPQRMLYPIESPMSTNNEEKVVELQPSIIKPVVDEGTASTVRPADFDVDRDCNALHQAFNAPTVDEGAIIHVLCNRTAAQRLRIRDIYRIRFNESLNDAIEREINGNVKKIFKILLLAPIEHDCYEIRRVLTGVNTDENVLIEIFLTRTNEQIQRISETYSKLFQSSLEHDITDDRDSFSRRLARVLLRANRPIDDEVSTRDEQEADARFLFQSNSKWRMDGSTFLDLIAKRSNECLREIFAVYQQISGIDIEQAIKNDTDVELSRPLMTIVRLVRNRARYFAYELRKSLKGTNTNEENVIRLIISRCEIDLVQIKIEYEKVAKRTLYEHIQTDTSGNIRRVLSEFLCQRLEPTQKEMSFRQSLESINQLRTTSFDRNNRGKSQSLSTLNSELTSNFYINRSSIIKQQLSTRNSHDY